MKQAYKDCIAAKKLKQEEAIKKEASHNLRVVKDDGSVPPPTPPSEPPPEASSEIAFINEQQLNALEEIANGATNMFNEYFVWVSALEHEVRDAESGEKERDVAHIFQVADKVLCSPELVGLEFSSNGPKRTNRFALMNGGNKSAVPPPPADDSWRTWPPKGPPPADKNLPDRHVRKARVVRADELGAGITEGPEDGAEVIGRAGKVSEGQGGNFTGRVTPPAAQQPLAKVVNFAEYIVERKGRAGQEEPDGSGPTGQGGGFSPG